MELTFEQLGITPEDIADRAASKIAATMLAKVVPDFDDETGDEIETEQPTAFQEMIRKRVVRKIEQAVDTVAEQAVGADLAARLDAMTFPQTNRYGEPKADPLTLREVIVRRADTFLVELVDHEGRSRDGYGTKQTRVTWLIDKHLQYTIDNALTGALKNANEQIVEGIAATVKIRLADIATKLKGTVKP